MRFRELFGGRPGRNDLCDDVVVELPQHCGHIFARKGAHGFKLSTRSEEHTSELQSLTNLVCRLLLEKKKFKNNHIPHTSHHYHDSLSDHHTARSARVP